MENSKMRSQSKSLDDIISADLAVATRAGQIKTGSLCRGESE